MLIDAVKHRNKEAIIIVNAQQINEGPELYKRGADYVIMPHFLGGEYVSQIIKKYGFGKKG